MTDDNEGQDGKKISKEVSARNRKLAIVLGLLALGIYVLFIFIQLK